MPLDLFSQDSTSEQSDGGGVPSYMIAANNHNIGNLNASMIDPEGYADKYGNAVSRAGKFIASAALSGVNSFYNTAVWAGNMFSDKDAEYRDTRDWIASFDDNLGDYYQDNRQAADLVGFVATSFVPGLGGVKVLNAGMKALNLAKEGSAGANMARGLGLIPGSRDQLVKTAVASYDTTRTAFSLSNPATLKAVAAGFGEQALQAAAWETAVVATMKKSPILTDMDVGDTLANMATGTLLGGAIGGTLVGAGTLWKVKQGIGKMDAKLAGVTQDMKAVAGTRASDELLLIRNDLDTLAQNAPEGVDPDLYARLWEQKIGRLDNASREGFTKLFNTGDEASRAELGNLIYEGIRTDPTGMYAAKLAGLEEIATQQGAKNLSKKYGLESTLDAAGAELGPTHSIRHFKLWGDNMGMLSDDAPAALHLADMIKGPIKVQAGRVQAGDMNFKVEIGKYWNVVDASYEEALARNIWAMDDTVPPLTLAKNQTHLKIGTHDIPMLTKAYREGFQDFKLITAAGEEIQRPSNLLGYLKTIKERNVEEMWKKIAAAEAAPKYPDTRNSVYRFHGTSSELPAGGPTNDAVYEGGVKNIYGQGFYTTDALDVAQGYMKKGRGNSPTLYNVKENTRVKLYNMNAPLTSDMRKRAEDILGDLYFTENAETGAPLKSLADVFDEARRQSSYEGYSAGDVQDMFMAFREQLEDQGYRGFVHTGGGKTGTKAHEVKIYWHPETDLKVSKDAAEKYAAKRPVLKPTDTIEHITNKLDIPLESVTGAMESLNPEDAVFGLAKTQKDWFNKFAANTPNPPDVASVKPWMKPQNYQMVYRNDVVAGLDNFQVEAIVGVRQRQIIQQTANDNAVAAVLGDDAQMIPSLTEAEITRVSRGGAGAGFFSFANANYGSAGSKAEYVGSLVTKWIQRSREGIANKFMTSNYQVVNNPREAARLAAIMQKARQAGSEFTYMLDDAGENLVLTKVDDYNKALERGEEVTRPIIPQGIDEVIPLESVAVRAWVGDHISANGARVTGFNNLRGAKGLPAALDARTFYPPAPNPDRFKFHAFVTDDSKITSTGHTTMLYADSAQNLEKQIAAARSQGFEVFTPDQTAAYYKARGRYDYSKGLNENQIDTALRRSGVSAPAFPITGTPQEMLQDIMEWHAKEEAILIREAVSTKLSREFGVLNQMGAEYASTANATMGWKGKFAGEAANPFEDYIKTFLGASLKKDYPLWTAMNNFVDQAGQKVYNAVASVWKGEASVRGMSSPKKLKSGQYDWEEVNNIFDRYGIRMAATDAQMEAWVSHPAGQGAVSKFISQQNAILSSLVLRLDPVNALNNAVGSTILTGAETNYVIKNMLAGNAEAVGDLAKLSQVLVPGVEDSITSAPKLIASAYRNFFGEAGGELLEMYKKKGYISSVSQQFRQLLDVATIKGTETAAELESKAAQMAELFRKVGDFGEKWTGNKIAEEMNRFVSANIMDQITSIGVNRGLIDQPAADAMVNTFVNRTQGNMIASQRPQLFQGPLGQAIGLFQTYQFNIMQQLLRYVGEGSRKDALTLMGLQGTIYGANGLPGFQAINQHIIGTASGNTQHTDAYSSINNVAGKTAGDWITYGVASNLLIDPDLKINLYSRGDINPRQVTVVPSNMADIPIVSAWAKFASSAKNALGSVANGGDVWQSVLSGIEHNGISRPLAGMARVARGFDGGVSYSTTGKGNIVSSNDLLSLANLARISGAKPFDEAVTQDAVYRIQAYQAVDRLKREKLGAAVKSVIANGDVPSQEQLNDFMAKYASTGGRQEEFSKWYVSQLRAANTPQANKIVANAQSPYAMYMQQIMGGRVMATPPDILSQQEQPE